MNKSIFSKHTKESDFWAGILVSIDQDKLKTDYLFKKYKEWAGENTLEDKEIKKDLIKLYSFGKEKRPIKKRCTASFIAGYWIANGKVIRYDNSNGISWKIIFSGNRDILDFIQEYFSVLGEAKTNDSKLKYYIYYNTKNLILDISQTLLANSLLTTPKTKKIKELVKELVNE